MSQVPKYLNNMFSWSYQYNTRQAESGLIKLVVKPKLDIRKDSFRWRAANEFNQLPIDIRISPTIDDFKVNAKIWIKANVSFS